MDTGVDGPPRLICTTLRDFAGRGLGYSVIGGKMVVEDGFEPPTPSMWRRRSAS